MGDGYPVATRFHERHEAALRDARRACLERSYFTLFPETPDRHRGGAAAAEAGAAAFHAQLGRPFELDQPGTIARLSRRDLAVHARAAGHRLSARRLDALFAAARARWAPGPPRSPHARLGTCMEIVDRLYEGVFEIGASGDAHGRARAGR